MSRKITVDEVVDLPFSHIIEFIENYNLLTFEKERFSNAITEEELLSSENNINNIIEIMENVAFSIEEEYDIDIYHLINKEVHSECIS